uniref:Claudin n=1 Tax=Vombatus ursinus TaxID=29139 RepID=A0A4X2JWQ5_VOMUR
MSVAVEILGFFLGALGLLMLGVTLPNGYWRVSSIYGNVITTSTIFENLWYSCATDSTGVYNCREFPSLLALSGTIQACRALMITGIILSSLGVFLGIVGLQCTQIGSLTSEGKARLAATAGALHILAGKKRDTIVIEETLDILEGPDRVCLIYLVALPSSITAATFIFHLNCLILGIEKRYEILVGHSPCFQRNLESNMEDKTCTQTTI